MAVKKISDGKWELQGYVTLDGVKRRYHRRGFSSKSEAIEAEVEIRKKLLSEVYKDSDTYFCYVAKEYIELTKPSVKESTYITYINALEKANKIIGKKPIGYITASVLQNYISKLDATYSKKYVSMQYYVLNKVFKYAVTQGYISNNPLKRVILDARKNELEKKINIFEPDEFNKFINVADNDEYKCFFMFLYYMGTRKGEARALTWNDINFENKTVRIEKTLSDTTHKISPPKTKNSFRTITIPNILLEELHKHYDVQKKYSEFNNNVFVFGYDKYLPSESIRRHLKKWIEKANLHDIRVHDLRHSHASYLINNMSDKFTVYDIAKRLGDTVNTVLSTYAHWFKAGDKKLVEMIDNTTNTETTQKQAKSMDLSQLRELKQMLDDGILTEEEFTLIKKQILGI